MTVTDWRAWVNQPGAYNATNIDGGGTMPIAGDPYKVAPGTAPVPFPGVGPIPDLISGTTSIPMYPNTPTTIRPMDPFYVGTYPTGAGWVSPMENVVGWNATSAIYQGMPGVTLPTAPIMRPPVPGLSSP